MALILSSFLNQMYWIDITIILVLVGGMALYMGKLRTHAILESNIRYNKELLRVRREVYEECEKNFFL